MTSIGDKPARVALITVKLTAKELDMLTVLAADQLFRREFIDSRFPGHRNDPADLSFGKHLLERLRCLARPGYSAKIPSSRRNGTAP
ncbi:MAG TPA: hypothetical protein VGR73_18220 [Bryobacteraceae bacterium]|nr:hypothetical protein [Bryobacteraceae bacterium]